jgi:hypothetical protein
LLALSSQFFGDLWHLPEGASNKSRLLAHARQLHGSDVLTDDCSMVGVEFA